MVGIQSQVFRPGDSGVWGTLFTPVGRAPEVGALVIGGSGGNEPDYLAEPLAREGIAALSVAYFGQQGLPTELAEVDLEYFETALTVLRNQATTQPLRVVAMGQSRGSEAAVLTAVHFRDLVDAVCVSVPGNVALCGYPSGGPAWRLNGVPVPYTDEFGPECSNPAAVLPVEQVHGPIMLVAAGADEVWPSLSMARAISARLRQHGDRYGHQLLEYPSATHSLGYLLPKLLEGLLPQEPGEPAATQQARAAAWPQVRRFIQQVGQAPVQSPPSSSD